MTEREHGFTLVELIVVLLVLAMIAGITTTRIVSGRDRDVLQSTAYQVASRCRSARTAAIRRGSEEVVLIDLANRVVETDGAVKPIGLAATITVHAETSLGEQLSPAVSGIRFRPDGSSSGGTLKLESGSRAYEIRINWFTGRVTVTRTS
jgi:general secretion pathway protein H